MFEQSQEEPAGGKILPKSEVLSLRAEGFNTALQLTLPGL